MDPFFQLKGETDKFGDDLSFFDALKDLDQPIIENSQFSPEHLFSPIKPRVWRVKGKTFRNFSFSKTEIHDFEFQNCMFEDCLFLGTIFVNCRFTECEFIRCNVHRFELRSVHVNPRAFIKSIPAKKYANVGVHLFQELLRNSRMQSQPDFSDEAQFMFRRWQRYLNIDELPKLPLRQMPGRALSIGGSWLFEFFLGSGVRLSNLALTTVFLLISLTTLHWHFREQLGLSIDGRGIHSFADAFYFTTVTLTTLGYGDIAPGEQLGRIVIGFEALLGFVLLATFASTVFRKFSS